MKKTIIFIALLCCNQMNAQLCFNTATYINMASGSMPVEITSADFNGDTKNDLAITNYSLNSVSILLGSGTGTFVTLTSLPVGNHPCSITSADFNGDGIVDLITTNQTSNSISLLLGTGTGSFSTATNFTLGTTPVYVISTDFNGDSKADLAVINSGANPSILLGTGTGSFGIPTSVIAGTTPIRITSGDFNADGKVDLAVANNTSFNVSILLGTGTGSFGSPTNFLACNKPGSIINTDFNGDGKLDLAVANVSPGGNDVAVLLGNGTGGFGTAVSYTMGTNTYPFCLISKDFNGDGKKDLAVANNAANNISILLGNGSGSFGVATNFSTGISDPRALISADFNGDGKLDIITSNATPNKLSVLLSCNITSINQLSDIDKQLIVYPNPASEIINIETMNTVAELKVSDMLGNEIVKGEPKMENGILQLNVRSLSIGVYYLSIKTNENIFIKKIVVNR